MGALADFLDAHRDQLLARFEEQVERMFAPRGLSRSELRDHLPDFLDDVVQALREGTAPAQRLEAHNPTSEQHGRQRLHVGFDLDALVREYGLLSDCVLELLEETDTYPTLRELRTFQDCLVAASADSVTEYVEQAEELQHRMLGIVSHDVRGPLSAITLSTAILQQQGLTPAQQRHTQRIASSTARIEELIASLLDFALARLGRLPLRREPTSLEALCRRVLDEVQVTHPERTLRLESTGDTTGEWDPARLMQVAGNLLANAIKYGEGEARVVLRGTPDTVVLQVHNRGAPIPPHVLPQLFKPFRRGAHDDDTRTEGIGLGLYIAHEVVRAHGGTITVTSSAEGGTTFTVELPRKPAAV